MDHATVGHNVNGTTKTARFTSPVVTSQLAGGVASVSMQDEVGGPVVGYAKFSAGGLFILAGRAVEQYGPLSKPEQS